MRDFTPNNSKNASHGAARCFFATSHLCSLKYIGHRWWQLCQDTIYQFWICYLWDFLSTLQSCYKWQQPTESLDLGKVVMIIDPNLPHAHWSMGRMVKLIPSRDGQVWDKVYPRPVAPPYPTSRTTRGCQRSATMENSTNLFSCSEFSMFARCRDMHVISPVWNRVTELSGYGHCVNWLRALRSSVATAILTEEFARFLAL